MFFKMTEGDKKRKAIFDRFSDNLKLLVELGLLPEITPKFERTVEDIHFYIS
jgi:hypothetical protein